MPPHLVLKNIASNFADLGAKAALFLIEEDLRLQAGHQLRSAIDKLNIISYSEGDTPRTTFSVVSEKVGVVFTAHIMAQTPIANRKIAIVRYEE